MAVSYKKLWKMLIDKDMKKKDLCAKAGISTASVTKMGKGGHVTTEVIAKICKSACRVKYHLFIQDKFPYILISPTRQQHSPEYMSYIKEINIEKPHP